MPLYETQLFVTNCLFCNKFKTMNKILAWIFPVCIVIVITLKLLDYIDNQLTTHILMGLCFVFLAKMTWAIYLNPISKDEDKNEIVLRNWTPLINLLFVPLLILQGIDVGYFILSNIYEMTGIVILYLLYAVIIINGLKSVYKIDPHGISKKDDLISVIKKEDITELEFHEDKIAIHTLRYRNDFVIKKKKLFHPSWDDLIDQIRESEKLWLGVKEQ